VLIAEQLFASGCRLLISITSAGQIAALDALPCVVLIDRALRDEGTSAHYLAPATGAFVAAPDDGLIGRAEVAVREALVISPGSRTPLYRGATWTTDAPYRETATAIAAARDRGVLAVEMEASALYAFATAKRVPIVCFAHVTNTMGQQDGDDFEKGESDGSVTALRVIEATARVYQTETLAPD
jgi:uridine phosphorylase